MGSTNASTPTRVLDSTAPPEMFTKLEILCTPASLLFTTDTSFKVPVDPALKRTAPAPEPLMVPPEMVTSLCSDRTAFLGLSTKSVADTLTIELFIAHNP